MPTPPPPPPSYRSRRAPIAGDAATSTAIDGAAGGAVGGAAGHWAAVVRDASRACQQLGAAVEELVCAALEELLEAAARVVLALSGELEPLGARRHLAVVVVSLCGKELDPCTYSVPI